MDSRLERAARLKSLTLHPGWGDVVGYIETELKDTTELFERAMDEMSERQALSTRLWKTRGQRKALNEILQWVNSEARLIK